MLMMVCARDASCQGGEESLGWRVCMLLSSSIACLGEMQRQPVVRPITWGFTADYAVLQPQWQAGDVHASWVDF